MKLGKKLSRKAADGDSDDDDDEEPSLKPVAEVLKKNPTEIPLILAPSHLENEANPWLTTTASPVLPASEYSKPNEVRNEETSSSENEEEEEEQPVIDETYGVTSTTTKEKLPEQLKMPMTTKRVETVSEEKDEHRMNIQEAFADDDVLAEFEKEKNDTVERDRPKAIDLSLPGWGEWAGTGVKVNQRKKRKYDQSESIMIIVLVFSSPRFLIPPKPAPPRRDVHLQHVIINEKADEKISAHRVCSMKSFSILSSFFF